MIIAIIHRYPKVTGWAPLLDIAKQRKKKFILECHERIHKLEREYNKIAFPRCCRCFYLSILFVCISYAVVEPCPRVLSLLFSALMIDSHVSYSHTSNITNVSVMPEPSSTAIFHSQLALSGYLEGNLGLVISPESVVRSPPHWLRTEIKKQIMWNYFTKQPGGCCSFEDHFFLSFNLACKYKHLS